MTQSIPADAHASAAPANVRPAATDGMNNCVVFVCPQSLLHVLVASYCASMRVIAPKLPVNTSPTGVILISSCNNTPPSRTSTEQVDALVPVTEIEVKVASINSIEQSPPLHEVSDTLGIIKEKVELVNADCINTRYR